MKRRKGLAYTRPVQSKAVLTPSLLAAVLLGAASLLLAAPAEIPARPNVLVICADDHSAEVFGAYGNSKVRTPNLDRLSAEGVRFDRAYCNSPVCTASRQS